MAKTKAFPYQQSVRIKGLSGINNVVPAEKCKPEELQTATNIDINSSKEALIRQGTNRVYTGNVHSLFSNGSNGNATFRLFREGAILNKLNSDYTATQLRSDIVGSRWMEYLALNNLVYYSDGVITGITDGVTSRSWGLTVPSNQLVLTQTTGLLASGRYLCTITYLRNDGQESGSPGAIYIDTTGNSSGIAISNIPVSSDTTVTHVNIYLSSRNGDVLYKAASVTNGTTSKTYSGTTKEFNVKLATQFLDPPPPGTLIQFHNGRIYIIDDKVVWYTEPYNYELVNLAHNYLIFPYRVTLFAPVNGGIWVSMKHHKTFFLEGGDPDKFITHNKTEYGAIEGSQQIDEITTKGGEKAKGWFWTADDGIYFGLDGGRLLAVTDNRYTPVDSDLSVSFLKKTKDGSKQYLSSLF